MFNILLTVGDAEVPSLLHKMAQKCNNDDNDNHSPFSVNHGPTKDIHWKDKNTHAEVAQLYYSSSSSHSLQVSVVAVQLHLDLVQLLDLLVVALRLVAHQRAVEVNGEHQENYADRHHDDGGGQRRLPAAVWRGGGGGRSGGGGVHRQELDPAEQNHLSQEEQDAQRRGEAPGQLDVVVHALVRRLADRVEVVDVANGLHVGQDAGADEQGEEMHGHQHRGAHAEGDEERTGVVVLRLQLGLHHGHLRRSNKDRTTLMKI